MIAILTSGVALGAYVPGLLLARRLNESGTAARVDVLERLFPGPIRDRIQVNRRLFHRDFRLARAAHALARDQRNLLDADLTARLLEEWTGSGVSTVVVFSGFWAPVVDAYQRTTLGLRVERCHVDAIHSPSFQAGGDIAGAGDVWLMDSRRGTVDITIPVSGEPVIPWADREPRMLVHGGGWGMGTFLTDAQRLARGGVQLDVVAHERADITFRDGTRYFTSDPDWQPWSDGGFPPFGEVRGDGSVGYRAATRCPASFDLVRQGIAVVSKPGAGTLLDSLHAATPMILLEPLGEWEEHNGRLWQRNGFAVSLDEWCSRGRPLELLGDLHRNLLRARSATPSYADRFLEGGAVPGESPAPRTRGRSQR
ncbi:hypothetical protein [Actinoplanes derwentensis]|uniref:UDP-N-acetylglucosamine:LPS N-acetylglucosamine transferase n=1 Tax=Actinoplanes derwentensis TaxID=113562 RepID=A0A1H2DDQ0_9ACTN|nr:hypothetical protein [Actinoplanes derwentensis]GID90145.1 hypothetical protein Ade03nite_90690 [Actinoplanes derwentensis]SDT80719.1 hypothetical protein SAMN04489716_9328 [Actinoplanes derwentensis]